MMLKPNSKALSLMVSDKINHVFPIYAYVKHVTSRAGQFLAPGG